MGVNIHIPADEVWSFFQKNKERCSKEMIAIAENTDTEYAVYLTEENGYPSFCVCKGDDSPEYEEGAISENDCTDTAKRCFLEYLFPVVVTNDRAIPHPELDDDEDELETRQAIEDAIYEREDELRLAMCDFLQVVLCEGDYSTEIVDACESGMVDEILDHVLEYIATVYCLDVYRPTLITDDEDGCEMYTEYPYDPDVPFEETYKGIEEDDLTMDYRLSLSKKTNWEV